MGYLIALALLAIVAAAVWNPQGRKVLLTMAGIVAVFFGIIRLLNAVYGS